MTAGRALVVLALAVAALGCARKVVVHPNLVPLRHERAWVIQRDPASAPALPAPATAPNK